jgi:hypothetical protein
VIRSLSPSESAKAAARTDGLTVSASPAEFTSNRLFFHSFGQRLDPQGRVGRNHLTGCLIEIRIIGIITAEQTEDGNKKFKVTGTGGPKKATQFLKNGIQAHKKKMKKS